MPVSTGKARHFEKLDKNTRIITISIPASWGNANNYDLCINSASHGIDGTVPIWPLRMIGRDKDKKNRNDPQMNVLPACLPDMTNYDFDAWLISVRHFTKKGSTACSSDMTKENRCR